MPAGIVTWAVATYSTKTRRPAERRGKKAESALLLPAWLGPFPNCERRLCLLRDPWGSGHAPSAPPGILDRLSVSSTDTTVPEVSSPRAAA